MTDLILTTFNWVPEMPRGYVRDLRVRWALEEAGLPYRVESVPFDARGAEHFAHQPFGQVPWLTDGGISIFESGAILLHLGLRSEALMPTDPRGRSKAMEWLFAALKAALIKYRHRHQPCLFAAHRAVGEGSLAGCRDDGPKGCGQTGLAPAYRNQWMG